ncbi:MAG TPA: 50S ribosomal protein L11 methyltransferase, partial [Dehalococcoidia bacterium]|nr:50S ribosomal protein L11 methyltransferase [Dehalococcoidia bacterium]
MTPPDPRWLKVGLAVHPELVEPISAVFHQWGQGGVQIEEDLEILPEEQGIRRHPDRPVRVVTYLPGDDLAGERLTKLRAALDHLHAIWPLPEIDLEVVNQEDWANAWKEHFPVHRLGRRTVIKPTWRDFGPGPDDLVIELDPGMAFGTGLHPTTQACAELIEVLPVAGARALDLGTGS